MTGPARPRRVATHRRVTRGWASQADATACLSAPTTCPVAGSKKWRRAVSTASSSSVPGVDARSRVDDGGEDRPLVVREQLSLVVALASVARPHRLGARRAGASIVKITWLSAPRSSTTSGLHAMRGRSGVRGRACSKSVGRIPRITPRSRRASGRRAAAAQARSRRIATAPPTISASTRFIDGEPMNAATNRFAGRVEEVLRRVDLLEQRRRAARRPAARASSPRPGRG